MRPLILLLAMCLFSLPVQAEEEYRYDVDGVFTLTEEGAVSELEFESRLPRALGDFVTDAVNAWRFEPIIEDGQAVSVRVRFYFEIIGTPDGDEVIITLGDAAYREVSSFVAISTTRPQYPFAAVSREVQAAVVVEFLVGPDGRITDLHTTRVGILDADRLGERSRNSMIRRFIAATERAVVRWRFSPPPDGVSASGRYTIEYRLGSGGNGWRLSGEESRTTWYEMEPAPWRLGSGERVAGGVPSGGEYNLGDARIRRLPDAAPGG